MIKKIILGFLASLGFFTLLIGVGGYWGFKSLMESFSSSSSGRPLEGPTVLVVSLGATPLVDSQGGGKFLSQLQLFRHPSLIDLIQGIEKASQDPHVHALVLKIEGHSLSLAQAQDLSEALLLFKKSGKKIYAFAYSFGEGGKGTTPYYLATFADHIGMQPQGSLELTGYSLESYFLKDLFDRYKIIPQFATREAYKGVVEPYMRKEFSPEVRANLAALLDNLLDQALSRVALRFQEKKETLRHRLAEAPFLDQEALAGRWVDELTHWPEFEKKIREEWAASPPSKASSSPSLAFVPVKEYLREGVSVPSSSEPKTFGLVCIEGGISTPAPEYEEGNSPALLAKQLRKMAENPKILAIILRIDSPGGTVTGAETLWYEVHDIVHRLKKPIVVSMGTVAASAGYQIAAPASRIVANPATITGSIGVATGKMVLGSASEEWGIHLDEISTLPDSGMWSAIKPFTPEQWKKVHKSLDHYYALFQKKVAEGRHLSLEKVENLAKGQVWTGQQAKDNQLVDCLGGFLTAIAEAKKLTGLSQETPIEIVSAHAPKWELMIDWLGALRAAGQGLMDFHQSLQGLQAAGPHSSLAVKINA